MRWPNQRSVLGLVVAAGLSLGVASAQTPRRGGGERDAEVSNRRTANLSGPDQIREAGTIIDGITASRRTISDLLDRARQERDIIKVNCLNDKLTQVDVTLRSAREHQELLQTSVSINNDGQRNHEFTLLNIFRTRTEALGTEARQCVGEETAGFGDRGTVVTVRVSNSIPTQDTTVLNPDSLAPERPLVTSPLL